MAIITPNYSNSQALIPVGYPLVTVAKSGPQSSMELPTAPEQNPTGIAQSTVLQAAIVQAGDSNNRSV